MKRILTILLLTMITSTYIQAQNYRRYTETSEAHTSIIRSYPLLNHAEVAYSLDENSGYIELRMGGTTTGRVPVPLEYEVKDMKLHYNRLYFCGKHGISGFIAVANLNDIYAYITNPNNSPSTTAILYSDIVIEPYKELVSSLEKLIVYKDEDDPSQNTRLDCANEHIVAIGRNEKYSTYPEWMAIHIKYNTLYIVNNPVYTPNYIDIEVLFDITSPYNEKFQEVLLTDDYVTFVSYRYSTDEYILHRCQKYNLYGTFSPIYKYSAPQNEALSLIKGVAMEDNHIALASLAAENTSFGIRIRNIDLSSMLMNPSQSLPLEDQKHDVEMAYNKDQRKIVLMMYYLFNGQQNYMHSFIEIDPWTSSSYSPDVMYDLTPTHYNSIYHSNGSYFIAAAGHSWFRKALPMAVPPSDCFNQDNLSATPISSLDKLCVTIESEWKKGVHSMSDPIVPIEVLIISTECSTEY